MKQLTRTLPTLSTHWVTIYCRGGSMMESVETLVWKE